MAATNVECTSVAFYTLLIAARLEILFVHLSLSFSMAAFYNHSLLQALRDLNMKVLSTLLGQKLVTRQLVQLCPSAGNAERPRTKAARERIQGQP